MEALKRMAVARDTAPFERTLSFRAAGTGGIYAIAQRLRAFALGKPYQAEHGPSHRNGAVS